VDRPATTVAIFGEDRLTSQALALLLEGVGYDARILDGAIMETPSASLDGVEVVLRMPSLSDEREGEKYDSAKAAAPILSLSKVQEGRVGETGSVPWPCSMEALTKAIEAVLVPAAPSVKG